MARARQDELVLYSTVTFRSLLDSLARPGKLNQLEHPPFSDGPSHYDARSAANETPLNRYALGAFLTLLDKEVTFVMGAVGQWLSASAPAVQWVVLHSGTDLATPATASFAFFCDGACTPLARHLNVGTLLEPELSTTALYCVEQLTGPSEPPTEASSDWLTLRLSGPGIATKRTLLVAGLDRTGLEDLNTVRRPYPLGIDTYLVDAAGRCVGLPRTTRIQIIDEPV